MKYLYEVRLFDTEMLKKVYEIVGLIFLIPLLFIIIFSPEGNPLYSIYEKKLQIIFFSGFLTVGTFLLSLKTFVIIKLKEELFDSEKYRKRIIEGRVFNPDLSIYGPLKRLSTFLSLSVLGALITAALQLSLGFIPCKYTIDICISSAISALLLVLTSWYYIWMNLKVWFDLLDENITSNIV